MYRRPTPGGGTSFYTPHPDRLEQPPQQVAAHQRDADEGEADGQMLRESSLDPEPREDYDLRGDGQNVPDDDIRRGFHQRHDPALPHNLGSCLHAFDRMLRLNRGKCGQHRLLSADFASSE